MIATGLLMIRGIRLIERSNLVMVPLLLVLVIIVFIWSLTRQGALHGLKFFFTPDWGKLYNALSVNGQCNISRDILVILPLI